MLLIAFFLFLDRELTNISTQKYTYFSSGLQAESESVEINGQFSNIKKIGSQIIRHQ